MGWGGVPAVVRRLGAAASVPPRDADGRPQQHRQRSIRRLATAAALTFLNPPVYLDTVLLLGSLANQHGSTGRWVFAGGAVVGSVVWFFGLGLGARSLAPVFARPRAWQVLDVLIAAVMIAIAVTLASRPLAHG